MGCLAMASDQFNYDLIKRGVRFAGMNHVAHSHPFKSADRSRVCLYLEIIRIFLVDVLAQLMSI